MRLPFKPPFARLEPRVVLLRVTLLLASLLGLLASAPAWSNTRAFPLVPIATWFPILPSPADKILFVVMLAALVLSCWFYRQGVVVFLATSFFAFCEDQNRGQPWMYMYWILLSLSLAPAPPALTACRIAVSGVYFWGGIQKLNPKFFLVVPGWFVSPATKWHWPPAVVDCLKIAVATAPFVELAIAILLWFRASSRMAIAAALAVHGVSLVFLGPLGYSYNWVVWPWNLAMIALVLGLFSNCQCFQSRDHEARKSNTAPRAGKRGLQPVSSPLPAPRFAEALRNLRSCKPAFIGLVLFLVLPIFSFAGWWDSYFSFSLYAENAAHANLFITQAFADRLPLELRKYVQPFPQAFDPQHQGPLMFAFDPWCYEELHVPAIPEVRNFKGIFRHLKAYAQKPEDLRMIIGPRAGPVIFLEGEQIAFLKPM